MLSRARVVAGACAVATFSWLDFNASFLVSDACRGVIARFSVASFFVVFSPVLTRSGTGSRSRVLTSVAFARRPSFFVAPCSLYTLEITEALLDSIDASGSITTLLTILLLRRGPGTPPPVQLRSPLPCVSARLLFVSSKLLSLANLVALNFPAVLSGRR